jgi:FKBP-type peptidyl-prolyl cis-trans isomerase FkpA
MIKRILPIALCGAFILSINACKSDGGFKKTENGIEYKIVKDEKGASPKVGDFVELHMSARYKDDKTDTLLFDSKTMNGSKPMQFPMPAPSFKGDIVEAFMLLSPGDSAVIKMSIDSIKKQPGVQLPPFMKSGQKITYNVVMVSVKSQDEMNKEKNAHADQQKATDDQLLQNYFKANNLAPSKTASGIYYIIERPGTGENPKPGQNVTVNYTGRTLDGKVFDSNQDPAMGHAEPFSFPLGQGQVIPGWDEGVALLKKGAKAKLFIPSGLAYGANSPSPSIPNDAILMFDIEVLNIAAATSPSAQQGPQVQTQPPVQ